MPALGRLKRRPEFLKVAAARSKWATPGLVLQARCRQPQDGAHDADRPDEIRVGFTVSRKVGNAVRRNRARRRLRVVADAVLARRGQPGTDYVLIGRGATVDRPFGALKQDLETALDRMERRGGRRG